jgi:hypothetical protein
MTIQRQYSLPNCKLVLEGLSDATAPMDGARPLLTILVNAECHLAGYKQPLSGGREFLESLIAAVSSYAQEFLSGVHRPLHPDGDSSLVSLQKVDDGLHRLIIQPQGSDAHEESVQEPTQIDLATVQLFDLVEAVDQMFADTQTLPDLMLRLSPLAKRHITSSEPLAKRAVPAAIGVSSLTAAAALLFLVPVPQVQRPQPTTDASPAGEESTAASPSAVGSSSPAGSSPDAIASPSASPDAASPSPLPDATTSPSPTESPSADGKNAPLDPAQLETLLDAAPEVTAEAELRRLTLQLRRQLAIAWTQNPTFDQDLVYRVGVAENGDVLGFKYVNEASISHVDETPLLDLRYNPVAPDASSPEPIAQLRVVFKPNGRVEVSPWKGYQ